MLSLAAAAESRAAWLGATRTPRHANEKSPRAELILKPRPLAASWLVRSLCSKPIRSRCECQELFGFFFFFRFFWIVNALTLLYFVFQIFGGQLVCTCRHSNCAGVYVSRKFVFLLFFIFLKFCFLCFFWRVSIFMSLIFLVFFVFAIGLYLSAVTLWMVSWRFVSSCTTFLNS